MGVAQAKPACKHTIATRKCYQYIPHHLKCSYFIVSGLSMSHFFRKRHTIADALCFSIWLVSIISLAVIASVSVVVNISLFCLLHLRGWSSASAPAESRHLYRQSLYSGSSSDADDEMDSPSGVPSKTFFAGFDQPVAVKKTYPASHRSDRPKPSLCEDPNSCGSATGGLKKFPESLLPSERAPLNVSANNDDDVR